MSPRKVASPAPPASPAIEPDHAPCPSCGRLVISVTTTNRMALTLDTAARAYRINASGQAEVVPDVFVPHFITCTERKEPRRAAKGEG